MKRGTALATAVAVCLVVLWPVVAHPDRDGFPLSTYPMFSSPRSATEPISTVAGVDRRGRAHWLSPTLVNGTREVVQAAAVVGLEVAAGRADRLCREVAGRLAGGGTAEPDGAGGPAGDDRPAPFDATIVTVEVLTVRYDAVAYFGGRPAGVGPRDALQPLERVVHARCPVPR